MNIDQNLINHVKNNENKYKNEKMNNNMLLEKEFYTSFKNYEKHLIKKTSYETALWIESNEKHLTSIGKSNSTKYKSGQIVLIDLGWNNYDNEFAYIHPAVIVKNTYDRVFIVPCTSRKARKDKNGNVFPEYIIGTVNDGFEKESVLMLNEARFVDKNGIISKIGLVTNDFYDKIYNKLFNQLFESKYYEIEN